MALGAVGTRGSPSSPQLATKKMARIKQQKAFVPRENERPAVVSSVSASKPASG